MRKSVSSFPIDRASIEVVLLDTSIAITIRDRGLAASRMQALTAVPSICIFTLIELEGGIHARPEFTQARQRRLEVMLDSMATLPFDPAVIPVYGQIVSALGFSRRQILDRLIAATAIVHGLTLVTANERDFADIPGLKLEVWPAQ